MELRQYLFAFMSLVAFETLIASALYFPTSTVNLSLPSWKRLPRPVPPLVKLHVVTNGKTLGVHDVSYAVAFETTSGLFSIDGDKVRLNEESFSADEIVSKREMVVVTARSGTLDSANVTINLLLTGDKLNCEKAKKNLCFWNGASFGVGEKEGPTKLGRLSSEFYWKLCKNYVVNYDVFKGREYFEVKKTKENSWALFTTNKIQDVDDGQIKFGLNCSISSEKNSETYQKEFYLTVARKKKLQIFFDANYKAPISNVIYRGEKIATWIVNDPGERKANLKFSLINDTSDNFNLECLPKGHEFFSETFYYECEITAKKTIYLSSSYSAYVRIEDVSVDSERSDRFHLQNVTLLPLDSKSERPSKTASVKSEKTFLLDLKYPSHVQISKKAGLGTRITEPILTNNLSETEVRKKMSESKVKFQMLSSGAFNVTETGGIVFVSNRHLMKETTYRVKITGVYPNGYRFFLTMQINVTDGKVSTGNEICEKFANDNERPSCSEKRSKMECEKTCGFSTGISRRADEKSTATIGCSWRDNEKPEKLSRAYQTCSPNLLTCPDRFCDPLESLFPKICPQDCTEYVFGSANKENHLAGIASATGVCTCDSRQKCLCTMVSVSDSSKQSERRKLKQSVGEIIVTRHREAISAVKASRSDQCGAICLLFIVGGGFVVVFGTSATLLVIYRRKMKKRCPNQETLKETMVNINYEEYVDRSGEIIRPLNQGGTIKEMSEHYDKKWEFPRYRLTIEETLGEGEFGKVLKARADGIGGNFGSTIVAVKTLKDDAKDSELADLISEYQLLKEIDHPNVIHLLGACTKSDGPLYIIIEYAKHGSLRNYLRKHRNVTPDLIIGKDGETNYVQPITPKDVLTFAWQIAKGMNYLTDMKLVHRDLAARNVLVAEGLVCKISDFGLTRDIYEDDTYLKRSKGRVPVKWMALESLADHIYTTKSDVWSYGVVLWELVTTGASPYPGIAGQNLFHLLKSGYRMEKPANCSTELYQILRSCWQENPSHRPTFKSLVAKLEEMLGEGKDYLDLNPRTVENEIYFSDVLNDEKEVFMPDKEERQVEENEIFKVRFEMFEKSMIPQKCDKCPFDKCECENSLRYENEMVKPKPRYENEEMEDSGYIQPSGQPKLVGSSSFPLTPEIEKLP